MQNTAQDIQNNKALIGRHCIAQGDNPGMASDLAPINNNPEGVALHHTMSPLQGYTYIDRYIAIPQGCAPSSLHPGLCNVAPLGLCGVYQLPELQRDIAYRSRQHETNNGDRWINLKRK